MGQDMAAWSEAEYKERLKKQVLAADSLAVAIQLHLYEGAEVQVVLDALNAYRDAKNLRVVF